MSLLLKDRVYSMEAPTAKRGVYPLHGYKLGLYRLPIKLEEPEEIQSVHDGMQKTFEMDMYADRIYATYKWLERNMNDPDAKGYKEIELNVTVEVVTGEVVDIIYQIFPIEKFGDPQWVEDRPQCKRKSRPLLLGAFAPDTATMTTDKTRHRRQTDARALELGHRMQALENAKELVNVVHVEADPVIAYEIHSVAV